VRFSCWKVLLGCFNWNAYTHTHSLTHTCLHAAQSPSPLSFLSFLAANVGNEKRSAQTKNQHNNKQQSRQQQKQQQDYQRVVCVEQRTNETKMKEFSLLNMGWGEGECDQNAVVWQGCIEYYHHLFYYSPHIGNKHVMIMYLSMYKCDLAVYATLEPAFLQVISVTFLDMLIIHLLR